MATIAENLAFTQIVPFEVDPTKQNALIKAIVAEVERWMQHRPGFVSSTFHASLDGRHVVNYAQWATEADFRGFIQDPNGERLNAAIRAIGPDGPHGIACRVVCSIDAPTKGTTA